jgi:iron complex outermembrane recepter protein
VLALGIPVEQSEEKFTPRIALTYEFNPDALVFVSATNGFKSGGWNTRVTDARNVTIFGPEETWSYELGARTEWFERRLRANVTLYYQDVKDLQLLSGTGAGTTSFVTRNAGDLEAYGAEFELSASVTDQFDVFLNAAFSDKEYKNLPAVNGAGGVPCSTIPEPSNCTTANDDPVRYPDVTAALGASYEIPLSTLGGSLTFNGAVNYSSPYWTSTYNDTPRVTAIPFGGSVAVTERLSSVPATTLLNVGAVFRSEDEHWEAALECSNCTEEYYATSSLFGIGYYNDPRRITFRVRYTY